MDDPIEAAIQVLAAAHEARLVQLYTASGAGSGSVAVAAAHVRARAMLRQFIACDCAVLVTITTVEAGYSQEEMISGLITEQGADILQESLAALAQQVGIRPGDPAPPLLQ